MGGESSDRYFYFQSRRHNVPAIPRSPPLRRTILPGSGTGGANCAFKLDTLSCRAGSEPNVSSTILSLRTCKLPTSPRVEGIRGEGTAARKGRRVVATGIVVPNHIKAAVRIQRGDGIIKIGRSAKIDRDRAVATADDSVVVLIEKHAKTRCSTPGATGDVLDRQTILTGGRLGGGYCFPLWERTELHEWEPALATQRASEPGGGSSFAVLDGLTTRAREALACFGERLVFSFLFRSAGCAGQPCAGRDVIHGAVVFLAQAIAGDLDRPAFELQLSFGVLFRLHPYAALALAAPLSMGAPTRLPHSVQEPS